MPWNYMYTFTTSGEFKYYCDVHQGAMTGKVVVNAAPGAASARPQPLGPQSGRSAP
jgi:hypothetical protein